MSVREFWHMACPNCGRDDCIQVSADVIVEL